MKPWTKTFNDLSEGQADNIASPVEYMLAGRFAFFKGDWMKRWLAFILVFLAVNIAAAQTEVEGEVSGVWDVDGSPYVVVGDAEVPEDERLTLEPGVEMIITADNIFTVHGEFIAEGEDEEIIHIRRPSLGPQCFFFEEEASDRSVIAFAHIDSILIGVNGSSPTFRNNLLFDSGIYLHDGSSSDFFNNTFDYPDPPNFSAIYCWGGQEIEIKSNILRDGRLRLTRVSDCVISDTHLLDGNIQLDVVSDITLENSGCFSLFIGDAVDLSVVNCEASNLLQVSDVRNFTIRGGEYGSGRLDHIRNGAIDSCSFESGITLMATEMAVTNTQSGSLSTSDWSILNIENCSFSSGCFLRATNDIDIAFRNNVVEVLRIHCENTVVENNTISHLEVYDSADRSTIIRENRILKSIQCSRGTQPFFYRNDIGSWNNDSFYLVHIDDNSRLGTNPLFVNNTFHEQENSRYGRPLVKVEYYGEAEFYNNLFLGDGNGSSGINVDDLSDVDGDYNAFWGVDPIAEGYRIGRNSIVENPGVMNRRNRDVHLLPNSPLIDSGTSRWNENDPDGTDPDIGCYYFDQREDHPPFIDGDFEVEADPFSDFIYEALVVDDGEEVAIQFEGLPEWLEVVDDEDGRDETFRLQGRPPRDGAEHYEFVIWARDDADQTDSMTVALTVNPNHRLWGEISGRLTREGSPYVVIAPLTVPEGEHLTIEPGVELRFRHYDDIPADARLQVFGRLTAVGTPEDMIVFTAESERRGVERHAAVDWHGLVLSGDNQDSTVVSYCRFEQARRGIECNSARNIRISYNTFRSNYIGALIYGESSAIVSNNTFSAFDSSFSTALRVGEEGAYRRDRSTVIISDNRILGFSGDPALGHSNGFILNSDSCDVYQNVFVDFNSTVISTNFAGPLIHNNIISRSSIGIRAYNESYPRIYNNIFVGLYGGCFFQPFSDSVGLSLRNNVFYECDSVAVLYREYAWNESYAFAISNNLLFANGLNFLAVDIMDRQLPLEGLGEIIDVNANGDSCDAYYNIFLDPLLIDPDSGDFHLTENSPCIDAGLDIGLPFGGRAPDIGAFEFDPINLVNEGTLQPDKLALFPNYPNPFNSQTRIHFTLPQESGVKIAVYDVQGRIKTVLLNDQLESGQHTVSFNAGTLASGIYFVRLETDGETRTNSMHLIK